MNTPNRVSHFEIPADNVARAKTFYEKAFSWKINEFPGMDYFGVQTVATNDKQQPTEIGGINGGLAKRAGPLTHPVFTIEVANIDHALAAIEKNGGKTIQKKQAVGDMGFTAYFKDSEGNVVGLYQNVR